MAWVYQNGTSYNDTMRSSSRDDIIRGFGGHDTMIDAGRYGQRDIDYFTGGGGNDRIFAHWGYDILSGGVGNDLLVSRSDAGEPVIGQNPSLPKVNPGEPLALSYDTLNGGIGADTFLFELNFNARPEVMARHAGMNGDINWEGVATENGAPHDHWIDGIGIDTIEDFYRDEGDTIIVKAHSAVAQIRYEDTNGDGRDDLSIVTLRSDSGGTGAHHNDVLGTIRIKGDLVTAADILIDGTSHHGAMHSLDDTTRWTNETATAGDDTLRTTAINGRLSGGLGNDTLIDGGKKGDTDRDVLLGGDGNDVIRSRWGEDYLVGGDGDDILVSRSDAGEPEIAQRSSQAKIYPGEPLLKSNDTMTGGLGADTFYFRLDLSGRNGTVAKHVDDDGHIHWHGVAGENNGVHLHWVESIGTDTITDFYRAEGDKIIIEGHTAQIDTITYVDSNGDGRSDYTLILVRSEQGGSGSHDEDVLAKIKVYGDRVTSSDITVDAMPAYGVADMIDDFTIL
jgi:Ca2+-binding RTX toxin-like protein